MARMAEMFVDVGTRKVDNGRQVDVQLNDLQIWGVRGRSKMWYKFLETFAGHDKYIPSCGYISPGSGECASLDIVWCWLELRPVP
jgi:hypothetical protein